MKKEITLAQLKARRENVRKAQEVRMEKLKQKILNKSINERKILI